MVRTFLPALGACVQNVRDNHNESVWFCLSSEQSRQEPCITRMKGTVVLARLILHCLHASLEKKGKENLLNNCESIFCERDGTMRALSSGSTGGPQSAKRATTPEQIFIRTGRQMHSLKSRSFVAHNCRLPFFVT